MDDLDTASGVPAPAARGLAESVPPAPPTTSSDVGDSARRRTFYHLLTNTLVVSVINYTVWFAVTFYVYLQTRSVFATGVIAGIFLALTALYGIWFGSLVDHHKKKQVMIGSTVASLIVYGVSLGVYLASWAPRPASRSW